MGRGSISFIWVFLVILLITIGGNIVNSNGTRQQSLSLSDTVELIGENDFTIIDGEVTISLDAPFKSFHSHKLEKRMDFVGWVYSGNLAYKYNRYVYEDFDIYTSNANYNLKNRNFDDRYITQITLKNANLKTVRGISIGSTLQEVVNLYGEGLVQKSNSDRNIVEYRFRDMALIFSINEEQKVAGINLMILVEAANKE